MLDREILTLSIMLDSEVGAVWGYHVDIVCTLLRSSAQRHRKPLGPETVNKAMDTQNENMTWLMDVNGDYIHYI